MYMTESMSRHEACCYSCATCRMNESCFTTTGMVCHAQLSMERSGSSTRAIRNIFLCLSMICKHGWALPASLSSTAQLLGSLSTPSRLLQSKRRRLASCILPSIAPSVCPSIYSSYSFYSFYSSYSVVHHSFIHQSIHFQIHPFVRSFTSSFISHHVRCLPKGQACVEVSLLSLCTLAEDVSEHLALDGIHKLALSNHTSKAGLESCRCMHCVLYKSWRLLLCSVHALRQQRAPWTSLSWGSVSLSRNYICTVCRTCPCNKGSLGLASTH